MRFGLSYVGFIYLLMLMIPNLIWTKNKPEDYERLPKTRTGFFCFWKGSARSLSVSSCWFSGILILTHGRCGACGLPPRFF